jgi:hypothetical protein
LFNEHRLILENLTFPEIVGWLSGWLNKNENAKLDLGLGLSLAMPKASTHTWLRPTRSPAKFQNPLTSPYGRRAKSSERKKEREIMPSIMAPLLCWCMHSAWIPTPEQIKGPPFLGF